MMSRPPAEQTWPLWMKAALRAWSTAVSKPSSVSQASAKTTLGFLPPSSRATFLTVTAAAWATLVPLIRPPVKGDQVDVGVLGEAGADAVAGTGDDVGDAGGEAGLGQQVDQGDGGHRGDLAGLDHEGVARGERRAIFQLAWRSG